jgi:hypothetical protein
MKPVDPTGLPGEPATFAEQQAQYDNLPAMRTPDGQVWSRWSLSEDERRAILGGANIELGVWTFHRALQPVYLRVQGVEEPAAQREEAQHGG